MLPGQKLSPSRETSPTLYTSLPLSGISSTEHIATPGHIATPSPEPTPALASPLTTRIAQEQDHDSSKLLWAVDANFRLKNKENDMQHGERSTDTDHLVHTALTHHSRETATIISYDIACRWPSFACATGPREVHQTADNHEVELDDMDDLPELEPIESSDDESS
ncbi:hypothetical protein C8R43DRAFT_951756 [Mycena crocata]|nr:hypothetical protein C8R43DRAFT_951756 [Mycena crocata]